MKVHLHTCTDYSVLGQLLDQQLHVGVSMGVQLPAGDTEVEPQPRRMTVAVAAPGNVLVLLRAIIHPGKVRRGLIIRIIDY